MGHIHAAAMAEYAKDAAETDKPWERWEFCHMRGEYQSLHSHPEWVEDNKYRRKPQVILINGHQVAEPAAPVVKPIKDAIDALVMAAFTEGGCSKHRMLEARIQTELCKKELLRTLITAIQSAAQGWKLVPVGWQFYEDGKWWNGDDRNKDHRKNTEEARYPIRDVYAVEQQSAQPDARDAARYRWLRDNDWRNDEKMEPVIRLHLKSN